MRVSAFTAGILLTSAIVSISSLGVSPAMAAHQARVEEGKAFVADAQALLGDAPRRIDSRAAVGGTQLLPVGAIAHLERASPGSQVQVGEGLGDGFVASEQ